MKEVDISSFKYTTQLTVDYLHKKKKLDGFYTHFPDIASFEQQIHTKKEHFSSDQRKTLVGHLDNQYQDIYTTDKVKANINSLNNENTFTVTTGHQLNLFTGPLYFIYKIVSCLDLADQLKAKYPGYHFVPVYWMASEDHDFEEISSTFFDGEVINWKKTAGNAVGRMSLEGLKDAVEEVADRLNLSDHSHRFLSFLKSDFLECDNYGKAFLKLVDYLFQDFGLVVLDADSKPLKATFTTAIKNDLTYQVLEKSVNQSLKALDELGYKAQVNPREINLFYFDSNERKRLIKTNDRFATDDGKSTFTREEILELVDKHPERFSPNVLMRPLYQETILPNLAYIGGGAELAYWLELKRYFDEEKVVYPIVFLRNGAMIHNEKQTEKAKKLCLQMEDLLLDKPSLDKKVTLHLSDIDIDFNTQIKHLKQQFKELYQLAGRTDASFNGAVAAQEQKQINGLKHLEKRLLKAEKKKREDFLQRAQLLKKEFYPEGHLQERKLNFLAFYQFSGQAFIQQLKDEFDAFDNTFYLIENTKQPATETKENS